MRLILVRHGQTDENTKGIIQMFDSKLTELGKKQARDVALKLKDEKIDIVYVSDLTRTIETAQEIIKNYPKIKVIHTKELREKDVGEFKGKSLEDLKQETIKSGLSFYDFAPEDGESFIDLQKRIVKFYELLSKQYKNKTVLVITHRGSIITLLLHLQNKSFEEYKNFKIDNTAIVYIINEFKKVKIKIDEN